MIGSTKYRDKISSIFTIFIYVTYIWLVSIRCVLLTISIVVVIHIWTVGVPVRWIVVVIILHIVHLGLGPLTGRPTPARHYHLVAHLTKEEHKSEKKKNKKVLWIRNRMDPELLTGSGSGIIVPDPAKYERADK